MSVALHRVVELIVGIALVGYCAYALHTGRILGKYRSYAGDESPGFFWSGVLITFAIGLAFLFGFVSWRK